MWLCKLDANLTKETKDSILYKYINETVDKSLIKQKQYMWDSVKKEEKSTDMADNGNEWNKILHFKEYINDKYNELRQDCIKNGIKTTMYVISSN